MEKFEYTTPPVHMFESCGPLWCDEELEINIKDNLAKLTAENEVIKSNVHIYQPALLNEHSIGLVWHLAHLLRVLPQVKFLATDIFKRYSEKQMDSITTYIVSSSSTRDSAEQEDLLADIVSRLSTQEPLRVASSLMIASKLTNHSKRLTASTVQKCLKKMDSNFSIKSIVQSERRILKQLQFRCNMWSSAVEYVGLVVAVVGQWHGSSSYAPRHTSSKDLRRLYAEELYEAAVDLLDAVYLIQEKIYLQLYTQITGSRIIPDNHKAAFGRVIADRMLLASSVVVAGAWVLSGEDTCTAVISTISTHINIPCKDLISLSSCILYTLDVPVNRIMSPPRVLEAS